MANALVNEIQTCNYAIKKKYVHANLGVIVLILSTRSYVEWDGY